MDEKHDVKIDNVTDTSNGQKINNLEEKLLSNHVLECFMIIEIAMTALEVIVLIVAGAVWSRWRRNYRNQMFLQISVIRLMKRIVLLLMFVTQQYTAVPECVNFTLIALKYYINLVIVLLVIHFIKHMYESLIIVFGQWSSVNLLKISIISWLVPLPLGVLGAAAITSQFLGEWYVYLLVCGLFRWPLIILGTYVYIKIVFKVLRDKAKRFMRGLTVITFIMCVTINVYILCSDLIELWCLGTVYEFFGHLIGLLLNLLLLILYGMLITGSSTQINK